MAPSDLHSAYWSWQWHRRVSWMRSPGNIESFSVLFGKISARGFPAGRGWQYHNLARPSITKSNPAMTNVDLPPDTAPSTVTVTDIA
jgi:hypothetical protein